MALQNLLDPVFSPLLALPSWLAILIISAVITVITTVAYKYLTDQEKMKKLKAEMKAYQKRIKELSKEDPKKAMAVQQEMMGKNMELMKQSFKPTLYTLIPLIIIFGWLNAHMAYEPLMPGEQFSITMDMAKNTAGNLTFEILPVIQKDIGVANTTPLTQSVAEGATWTLLAKEAGSYPLSIQHSSGETFSFDLLVSGETGKYTSPLQTIKQPPFKALRVSNEKIRPLEGFPLIGNWGWIGIYILFSMAMSLSLRKVLGLA